MRRRDRYTSCAVEDGRDICGERRWNARRRERLEDEVDDELCVRGKTDRIRRGTVCRRRRRCSQRGWHLCDDEIFNCRRRNGDCEPVRRICSWTVGIAIRRTPRVRQVACGLAIRTRALTILAERDDLVPPRGVVIVYRGRARATRFHETKDICIRVALFRTSMSVRAYRFATFVTRCPGRGFVHACEQRRSSFMAAIGWQCIRG